MQLFYQKIKAKVGDRFLMEAEETRHLIKVLRKKIGDQVMVSNGEGDLFTCQITNDHPKKCNLEVQQVETFSKVRNYYLHLLIAPTKTNDRFEFFLEKATEIGIDEITPILCEHSERKKIKAERYQKILLSAMKQSLQFHLPKLNEFRPFAEAVQRTKSDSKFIAHCEEEAKSYLFSSLAQKPEQKIVILIGPEGDFSKEEIQLAKQHEFKAVSLGKTRLRTETAGIFAVQQVATKFE